jgi:Glycosyltransferase WbsX
MKSHSSALAALPILAAASFYSATALSADPVHAAAYYFPNWGPKGQSEWGKLEKAPPRFPDHEQPKTPGWGEQNERDPMVMAQKIDAAADHGINAFIFCWYAFDGGKRYLDGAVRDGFLKAPNRDRLKFALMWANHDVGGLGTGKVTPETWEGIADELLRDYFPQPTYWRIEGRPYFSIYNPTEFVASFGGVEPAAAALRRFRSKAAAAGFPGLHLNGVLFGTSANQARALGLDSLTSYVWVHHQSMPSFPATDYATYRDAYFTALGKGGWVHGLERPAAQLGLPYFPNVTMGWDPSPRCPINAPWENKSYPFGPVLVNNTPAAFGNALRQAIAYLDSSKTSPRILTIYAWNEWSEGGYLEPEKRTGMAYLEVIKEVLAPVGSQK